MKLGSRSARPIFFLALAVALLLGGQWLRAQAGLTLDAESIREWVEQRGWLGPFLFILLLSFRQFVLVPSGFVLAAGGLLFGVLVGTALGTIGLAGSAVVSFLLARGLGGEKVRAHIAHRYPTLDRYVESTGPLLVFMTIAYPAGPMTLVSWAAGMSSVRLAPLMVGVVFGSMVRAGAYSFFGATLTDVGSTTFWVATTVLTLALVVPVAHPRLRRRLFRREGQPSA